jgi:predicted nucleotidyltransferase
VPPGALDLVDRIRRALAVDPPLRLAILFGSGARGALRPDSDVDVGIIPCDADLSLRDELDLQARLARACARDVDLVRLDRAPTRLRCGSAWPRRKRQGRTSVPPAVTDAALVLRKLGTLRDHVERVRRRRPATPGASGADVDLQDALAMSVLVAAQEAVDIALHIAADERWGVPSSYPLLPPPAG